MKQIVKKIIAREFLIFLTGFILFFILYISWHKLHDINKIKEIKLKAELTELTNNNFQDSLNNYVRDANKGNLNWEKLNSNYPSLKKYGNNVLMDYVATVNSGKYKKITNLNSKFPEFGFTKKGLLKNVNELEYLKKEKILKKTQNSFFNNRINKIYVCSLILIILCLLFLIRYLFYAVKWSFVELKKPDD
jgi:hypothetical protein